MFINEIHRRRRDNAVILIKEEQKRRKRTKKKLKKIFRNSVSRSLESIVPIEIGRHISKFLPLDAKIPLSKDINEKMKYELRFVKYKFDGNQVVRVSK